MREWVCVSVCECVCVCVGVCVCVREWLCMSMCMCKCVGMCRNVCTWADVCTSVCIRMFVLTCANITRVCYVVSIIDVNRRRQLIEEYLARNDSSSGAPLPQKVVEWRHPPNLAARTHVCIYNHYKLYNNYKGSVLKRCHKIHKRCKFYMCVKTILIILEYKIKLKIELRIAKYCHTRVWYLIIYMHIQ